MKTTNKIVQLSTVILNAAFIAAMLFIAFILVPFWKASEPQIFLNWFSVYSGNIGSFMIPLGPGVLILAILALVLNKENKMLWTLTVILTLINVLYFPLYFLPTNTSFEEQTIAINKVSPELNNWLKYHWQRTFFALGALITSVLAIFKSFQK